VNCNSLTQCKSDYKKYSPANLTSRAADGRSTLPGIKKDVLSGVLSQRSANDLID